MSYMRNRNWNKMLYIQVKAKSKRNSSITSALSNVSIKIIDENDNSPVFHGTFETTIKKTAQVGSTILTVSILFTLQMHDNCNDSLSVVFNKNL